MNIRLRTIPRPRLPGRRTATSAMAAVGIVVAGLATGSYLHHRPTAVVVNRTAETQLAQGLKIFSEPGGNGPSLGMTTGSTKPVCQVTGGTAIGVTDPGITGPGFVLLPGSTGSLGGPAGLPDCATVPAFNITTTTTPQTSGNCPQYDYQCEQQQADQSCQLTAEQQQALVQQAMTDHADLEQLYQQLLYKALAEQATAKAGSALLQQWLTGHTKATPQDIADLIKQAALTPLDAALAATQAISDLDEQTHRYAGTTCTAGPDTPAQANHNASNADSEHGGDGTGPASSSLKAVNPEAVDTSVDMNLIKPQDYVVRKDDKLLYREDERAPEVIYPEGFQPKDTSPSGQYNLADKVAGNKDGPYVSTTYDRGWVPGNTEQSQAYLYVVDTPGGIDMTATLGEAANKGEQEVDFPGGIKTERIIGAYVYEKDGTPVMVTGANGNSVQQFIPNPNYRGTRQAG
jgi:hypothetical protein